MKKIISSILTLLIAIQTFNLTSFAWAPSDIEDKCTGVYKLKNSSHISLPAEEGQKVCGCRTCKVNTMVYNEIPDYEVALTESIL